MSHKWNEILEQAIIGKVIAALIDDGFRIEISDLDGGDGLFVYAAADGGTKPEGGYEYWVRLTPGNGSDLITDYTVNLEDLLKPVNEFAKSYMD